MISVTCTERSLIPAELDLGANAGPLFCFWKIFKTLARLIAAAVEFVVKRFSLSVAVHGLP